MNKNHLMFWVRCPKCNQVTGVEPQFVSKYLDRVYRNRKERVTSLTDMLQSAQDDIGRDAAKKRAS